MAVAAGVWNVVTDITDQHWHAFQHPNLYLDAAGVLLGAAGVGTSWTSLARSGRAAASRSIAVDTATNSRRYSGNSGEIRNQYRSQISGARDASKQEGITAGYASQRDARAGVAGGAEAQYTNKYEHSLNPWAVLKGYSWAPLW
jgi:hypothetical protein